MRSFKKGASLPVYETCRHPFVSYIPKDSRFLVLGTFPTHADNSDFDFFYGNNKNYFWEIMQDVHGGRLISNKGTAAVAERQAYLESHQFGISDMLQMCYRKDGRSGDEYLYPIKFLNLFNILEEHKCIDRLILTSRADIVGALGLLKTYLLQQDHPHSLPRVLANKVVSMNFHYSDRKIEVMVPYSPSSRFINDIAILGTVKKMYRFCFTEKALTNE